MHDGTINFYLVSHLSALINGDDNLNHLYFDVLSGLSRVLQGNYRYLIRGRGREVTLINFEDVSRKTDLKLIRFTSW